MAPAPSSFLQTIGLTRQQQHRSSSPSSFSSSSSSFSPAMAEVSRTRPLYARLVVDNDNDGAFDPGALAASSLHLHHDDNDSEDSIPLTSRTARRHRTPKSPAPPPSPRPPQRYLPTARRFWADFTLGFADGLTVPFALTAGLSSLGRTDTVVYAGLAEVSAGCISMGIGGYLSARQSSSSSSSSDASTTEDSEDLDVEALRTADEDREKSTAAAATDIASVADRYLAPLSLPSELQQLVLAHVTTQAHAAEALLAAESRRYYRQSDDGDSTEPEYCYYDNNEAAKDAPGDNNDDAVWPVAAGLSVALGYVVGGLLPLWPYFVVTSVGDGLRWSFAVCVVALFLFGFIRDFALDSAAAETTTRRTSARQLPWRKSRIPWRRLWKSTFEGLQMVILGGIAAIAAVLCVRLFEGANTPSAAPS